MTMIEDLGEIAQLASEYISSLENLTQEVQHMIKEIEHKDAKVQELLPRLASRENTLREMLLRKDGTAVDADKVKADKLADKIKADYATADQLNAQKEVLSRDLWRLLHGHAKRLDVEIAKISPGLVQQTEASLNLQSPASQLPTTSTSITSAVLGALRSSPSIEASLELASTPGALKRKLSAVSSPAIKGAARHGSADRGMPSPSPLSGTAFSPSAMAPPPQKKLKHSGLSVMTKPLDLDIDGEPATGEEKDDRVYCHCQRVSFGEMIGCDNDDCPYEWFHLSCVGLSKPLPQTWYCTDCRERMEREKSERPMKKRKKQQG